MLVRLSSLGLLSHRNRSVFPSTEWGDAVVAKQWSHVVTILQPELGRIPLLFWQVSSILEESPLTNLVLNGGPSSHS